jgi:1,4-dihydroxy-2-naphthoate octaprenyltransferase
MFAFDRSALAVLVPLALLAGVVLFSNQTRDQTADAQSEAGRADQTVAANLPSR